MVVAENPDNFKQMITDSQTAADNAVCPELGGNIVSDDTNLLVPVNVVFTDKAPGIRLKV